MGRWASPWRVSADGALAPPHSHLSSAAAQIVIPGPLLIKLSGEMTVPSESLD